MDTDRFVTLFNYSKLPLNDEIDDDEASNSEIRPETLPNVCDVSKSLTQNFTCRLCSISEFESHQDQVT